MPASSPAKKRTSRKGGATFALLLSRADITDWLGLTLETASQCFSTFKRLNFIAFEQPERVTIRDYPDLEAIARGRARI